MRRCTTVLVCCLLGSMITALVVTTAEASLAVVASCSLVLFVVLPPSLCQAQHHANENIDDESTTTEENIRMLDDPFSEELNADEQRVMAESRAKAEKERLQKEDAERRRIEKEKKFEADLKRMETKKQRQQAKRQKHIDGRINQRIIKATQQKRYYDVVGIRNWNVKIGPIRLFCPTQQQIKKAYRMMAKHVHPDKNRDGRAEEAFRALEESAAILLDEKLRKEYDAQMLSDRMVRQQERIQFLGDCWDIVWRNIFFLARLAHRFLCPISTPLLILFPFLI